MSRMKKGTQKHMGKTVARSGGYKQPAGAHHPKGTVHKKQSKPTVTASTGGRTESGNSTVKNYR